MSGIPTTALPRARETIRWFISDTRGEFDPLLTALLATSLWTVFSTSHLARISNALSMLVFALDTRDQRLRAALRILNTCAIDLHRSFRHFADTVEDRDALTLSTLLFCVTTGHLCFAQGAVLRGFLYGLQACCVSAIAAYLWVDNSSLPWKIYERLCHHEISEHIDVPESPREPISIQDACAICLGNAMDHVLVPCGHRLCGSCSRKVGRCPVCRRSIRERVKIY